MQTIWETKNFRELRILLQPPKEKEPKFYYAFRVPSIYFTKLFLLIGLSPNQVTWISIITALAGVLSWAWGTNLLRVIGVGLFYMFRVLDCSDGEVARAQDRCSRVGLFYDLLGHSIMKSFIWIGLSIGFWKESGEVGFLLLGYVNTIGMILNFSVRDQAFRAMIESGTQATFGGTGSGDPNKLVYIANFITGDCGLIISVITFVLLTYFVSNSVFLGKILFGLYCILLYFKLAFQIMRIAKMLKG